MLCTVAVIVPLVFGVAPVPRELPFADNVAWLANEAEGDVVRLNVETGRIDARVGLDTMADSLTVGQGYGSVLVQVGDNLAGIDLASLTWGASVSVEGDLFVGEDVAYVVSRDGTVESLDPESLESRGEVDLGATVARPVVTGSRLVVPVVDGTVAVIEDDDIVERLDVGNQEDRLEVALVGDDAVAVNLTEGSLHRFDASHKKVKAGRPVDFEAPSGPVLLPEEASPEGRLWMAAPGDGELVGIDVSDGDTVSVGVSEPDSELVGPVVVGDRVYLVDLERSAVIEVDVAGPEVAQVQPIDISDPGSVEMLLVGDSVVINDRSSAAAVVVDDNGNFTEVDKYSEDGVAEPLPEADLASETDAPDSTDSDSNADDPGVVPPGQGNEVPPGQPAPQPGGGNSPDPRPPASPPTPTTTLPPPTTTTPPTTVPGVDPPGAVGGLSASSANGRASLSWSAPSGEVDDYTISVDPAINGQTTFTSTGTSYTFTNLTNGTTYEFTVRARNEGGTGPAVSDSTTPGRAPTVSGVNTNRTGDREFSVSFSYDAGGRSVDTCTVTVGGSTHQASCSGGTGTVSGISVSNFNTNYTFTANVGTSLGSNSANTTARSANKPLTVDADPDRWAHERWGGVGVCTWNPDDGGRPNTRPYFSTAGHGCPDEAGSPAGYLNHGTGVRGTCWTEGESVRDDVPAPNGSTSTVWVRVDGYGFMNALYFTTWNSNPEANLPAC